MTPRAGRTRTWTASHTACVVAACPTLAHVLLVLLFVLAVDQDVVEEHDDELVQVRSQQVVHHVHEGGGCIGQPEGQHQELIVPVSRVECGLRCVQDAMRI